MNKLTIQAVKALEVPKAGQTFLWDGELRGFGVCCNIAMPRAVAAAWSWAGSAF